METSGISIIDEDKLTVHGGTLNIRNWGEVLRNTIQVEIKLEDGAIMPSYANGDDSGADLFCKDYITVPPKAKGFMIDTGVKFNIPLNFEIQIRPKSGVSLNTNLRVIFGTIDRGYTGTVCILVDNISDRIIHVDRGTAIAQAVIQFCPKMNFIKTDKMPETDRANGGFGSTGRGL